MESKIVGSIKVDKNSFEYKIFMRIKSGNIENCWNFIKKYESDMNDDIYVSIMIIALYFNELDFANQLFDKVTIFDPLQKFCVLLDEEECLYKKISLIDCVFFKDLENLFESMIKKLLEKKHLIDVTNQKRYRVDFFNNVIISNNMKMRRMLLKHSEFFHLPLVVISRLTNLKQFKEKILDMLSNCIGSKHWYVYQLMEIHEWDKSEIENYIFVYETLELHHLKNHLRYFNMFRYKNIHTVDYISEMILYNSDISDKHKKLHLFDCIRKMIYTNSESEFNKNIDELVRTIRLLSEKKTVLDTMEGTNLYNTVLVRYILLSNKRDHDAEKIIFENPFVNISVVLKTLVNQKDEFHKYSNVFNNIKYLLIDPRIKITRELNEIIGLENMKKHMDCLEALKIRNFIYSYKEECDTFDVWTDDFKECIYSIKKTSNLQQLYVVRWYALTIMCMKEYLQINPDVELQYHLLRYLNMASKLKEKDIKYLSFEIMEFKTHHKNLNQKLLIDYADLLQRIYNK